jgi:uncharacterized membrane protein
VATGRETIQLGGAAVNWQLAVAVIGVIATIVSVGFNIFQYRRSRTYKELSYEPLSNFSVLRVLEEYQDSVTIQYREQVEENRSQERVVSNIHAIEMRLRNTGTDPVSLPGYLEDGGRVGKPLEQAVTLDFGDTEVISAKVAATTPEGKEASISKVTVRDEGSEREVVKFRPVMLNPTEAVSVLTLLTEEPADEPKVYGTIEGTKLQKSIPQEVQSEQFVRQMRRVTQGFTVLAVLVALIALGVFSFFYFTQPPGDKMESSFAFTWLIAIASTMLLYVLILNLFIGRLQSRAASIRSGATRT